MRLTTHRHTTNIIKITITDEKYKSKINQGAKSWQNWTNFRESLELRTLKFSVPESNRLDHRRLFLFQDATVAFFLLKDRIENKIKSAVTSLAFTQKVTTDTHIRSQPFPCSFSVRLCYLHPNTTLILNWVAWVRNKLLAPTWETLSSSMSERWRDSWCLSDPPTEIYTLHGNNMPHIQAGPQSNHSIPHPGNLRTFCVSCTLNSRLFFGLLVEQLVFSALSCELLPWCLSLRSSCRRCRWTAPVDISSMLDRLHLSLVSYEYVRFCRESSLSPRSFPSDFWSIVALAPSDLVSTMSLWWYSPACFRSPSLRARVCPWCRVSICLRQLFEYRSLSLSWSAKISCAKPVQHVVGLHCLALLARTLSAFLMEFEIVGQWDFLKIRKNIC